VLIRYGGQVSPLGRQELSPAGEARLGSACATFTAAALLLLACSSSRMQLTDYPPLDDGVCVRPLGDVHELWSGATLGVAADGDQTFFVGGDGHLRAVIAGKPPAVVANTLVTGAQRVRWGWLAVDRRFAYWVPGYLDSPRSGELQLQRVPKTGGAIQPGFTPPGPVVAVQIDDWGGLLLTEDGLWRLDLREWGRAQLLVRGQFAALVADGRRAYLRSVLEPGPMDFVAHQVLDDNGCHELASRSIIAVDRQTGKTTTLFSSKELDLFGPLVEDATHLYAAAAPTAITADAHTCRVRRLLSIPKDGGTVQSRRVPVGIGGAMAQDSANLFWIDSATGRVFRADKGGGPVAVVAQLTCRPNRLALAGRSVVVWKADGGQCPLWALSAGSQVASALVNLEAGDALLALGGGWAYVANAEDQVRRISLTRGTSETIRGVGGAPIAAVQAAVLGNSLYFIGPDFLGRWSPAGEVVRVFEGRARALAADDDQLFVATEDGGISVLGKTGGPRTVVVGRGGAVRDLVAMKRAAYWLEGPPPTQGGGRALWTSGPDGLRTELLAIDGMNQIATDGRSIYYATEGRSRLLPSDVERPGAIVRFADGRPAEVAGRQETITDLRASARGVFWRQRRGVRWVDPSGTLRAVDCTVADQGVGLTEADGTLYWADGTARALMSVKLR
jgi:hypothetical protein